MIDGILFLLGVFAGLIVPQAPAYYRISRHFYYCMQKRNKAIKYQRDQIAELRMQNMILKLKLIKKNQPPKRFKNGN